MSSESPIRLLLADDQEIVRHGVKAILADTEIKVVAEATTAPAAVKSALEKEVDVVLLDIRIPDGDGLAVLGRIKLDRPDLPVVLFSAFDNPASVAKAVAMGASGFLLKGCDRQELLDTVRAAAAGKGTWSKELLRRASLTMRAPQVGGSLEASLSTTEREILRHISQGLTNKQIAAAMDSKEMIIREHVKQILRKLGLESRTQAALWALRNNLV